MMLADSVHVQADLVCKLNLFYCNKYQQKLSYGKS